MVTRKDYENARKNASKESTKASDDGGYLNQRLNMDWGWLRSLNCLPFLGHEKWEAFLCASTSG